MPHAEQEAVLEALLPSHALVSSDPAGQVAVQLEQVSPVLDENIPAGHRPQTRFAVREHADPPSPFVPCPVGQVEEHVLHADKVVTSEYDVPILQVSQTRSAETVQADFRPVPVPQVEEHVLQLDWPAVFW